MSELQARFYNRVSPYGFRRYWDHASHELDMEGLSNAMGTMSSGERHLARFYASVWLKHHVPEELRFDLVEAVQVLDARSLDQIVQWVRSPWWP